MSLNVFHPFIAYPAFSFVFFVVFLVLVVFMVKPTTLNFVAMDKSPNSPKTHKLRSKLQRILGGGSCKTRSNPSSPVVEKPTSRFHFDSSSVDSLLVE